MRVGLDLTALQPLQTGVDVYLQGLLRCLIRNPGGFEYVIFVNREDLPQVRSLPPGFRSVGAARRARPARLIFQQLLLPFAARALRLDVIHSPAFLIPLYRGRARHVVTVYDLTILTLSTHHDRLHRSLAFRTALRSSLARSHRICVPTSAVAGQLAALLPDTAGRVRVVRPGLPPGLGPRPPGESAALARRLGLERPYVLYVGTLEPRKNLRRLVAAFRALVAAGAPEDLVLAGRLGWGGDELLADLAEPAIAARVHRLGYLPREDLAALYSGARLFVYPSLAEGFGFPPLEAMACGTPVVASHDPALVENLEGAAELVDPLDTAALAAAMVRVLRDAPHAALLRQRGLVNAARFGWEETARATVSCYRELAGGGIALAADRPLAGSGPSAGGGS